MLLHPVTEIMLRQGGQAVDPGELQKERRVRPMEQSQSSQFHPSEINKIKSRPPLSIVHCNKNQCPQATG